jgi:hypothetical protein
LRNEVYLLGSHSFKSKEQDEVEFDGSPKIDVQGSSISMPMESYINEPPTIDKNVNLMTD